MYGNSLETELEKMSIFIDGLDTLTAFVSDRSQMCSPVYKQVREIMDAVKTVLPDLEFVIGVSRVIALFAVNVGFQ